MILKEKQTDSEQDEHAKAKVKAAGLRGEAKAYTAVGAGGALALLASSEGLLLDAVEVAADVAMMRRAQPAKKGMWKGLAVVSAITAVGSMIYAYMKHSHADAVEASAPRKVHSGADLVLQPQADWQSAVRNETAEIILRQ